MPKAKLSKLNTLDNTDTETIFAFRFRLYWLFSALQDAGGYAISRQNNLIVAFGLPYLLIELFYIGMPVVRTDSWAGGRAVGVRSRDYQIFSDG